MFLRLGSQKSFDSKLEEYNCPSLSFLNSVETVVCDFILQHFSSIYTRYFLSTLPGEENGNLKMKPSILQNSYRPHSKLR